MVRARAAAGPAPGQRRRASESTAGPGGPGRASDPSEPGPGPGDRDRQPDVMAFRIRVVFSLSRGHPAHVANMRAALAATHGWRAQARWPQGQ